MISMLIGCVFIKQLLGLAVGIGLCACFCVQRRNKDEYDSSYNYDKAV